MILVCNDSAGATAVLEGVDWPQGEQSVTAKALKPDYSAVANALQNSERWEKAKVIADKIRQAC